MKLRNILPASILATIKERHNSLFFFLLQTKFYFLTFTFRQVGMCKSHWIAVLLLYNVLTWKIKSEKILQSSWPAKFRAKNRMGICSFCRNFLVRLGSWRSWEEKPEECEVVTHFHLWHYFWVLVSAFVLCFKFSLLLVSVKRPCRKSKQVLYPLFAEWFQSQHMSKYHLARLASSARFRYNTLSLTCKSLLLLFLAIFVVVVAIIFPLL